LPQTIADVRAFYHTYYVPDNATIVIAGDFKTDAAVDWVEEILWRYSQGDQTPIIRNTAKETATG